MAARTIQPTKGPQEAFLQCNADICIFGGTAGAGKTWALLLEALRHVLNPEFGAVIFRRESPQITNEGGLWDEAGKLYPLAGGTPRDGVLDYRFTPRGRPGGKVSFRHLQHEKDKYKWQGSQIPLICFDELTHFSESQFWYLLSRSRSMSGVTPYIRGTCNADASSWVKRLLAPWVDRKYPGRKAQSGEIRWIVRISGKITWGETREELIEAFPKCKPLSITFIRASIHDNEPLMRANPEYLAMLEALPTVERERLLNGNWDVVNEGLVYPDFGTTIIEPEDWPINLRGRQVGGIDWGFRDPFAALLAIEDVLGCLWIWWEHHESRLTPTAISKLLPRDRDEPPRWWADPSGASQIAEMRLADHDVIACSHVGQKPIKEGVATVTQRITEGSLKVKGDLGALIDEMGKYHYPPDEGKGNKEVPVDKDNHLPDALRYLIVGNDRGRVVKDGAPTESDEEREAREHTETEEREAKIKAHYDPDNDFWWQQ